MEDVQLKYLKTPHDIAKDLIEEQFNLSSERNSSSVQRFVSHSFENGRYRPWIKSPNISSLYWIGITTLEDGFAVLGTVYETRDHHNKLKGWHDGIQAAHSCHQPRKWDYEKFQSELSRIANEEDWENITDMDVNSRDLDDTNHFE
ncbi:hypothetical protein BDQ17DRAFT_1428652 [Cyathus striatus]|nr:hypothetical protein BDQ17DRAFT_1440485 [Cyathus striatus]KAF8998168.1 hypothetical protein BDQ17DRAFT_1428652 [Cyathus striatus]